MSERNESKDSARRDVELARIQVEAQYAFTSSFTMLAVCFALAGVGAGVLVAMAAADGSLPPLFAPYVVFLAVVFVGALALRFFRYSIKERSKLLAELNKLEKEIG
jgi:hypothetical protein